MRKIYFFMSCVLLLSGSVALAQDRLGNPKTGKVLYETHCLQCHGANARGDGPVAEYLIVKPTNFHSPAIREKSGKELLSTVIWGTVYSPMHGWWDRLSRSDMQDVVSYIRRLAPFQAKKP